MLWFDLILFLIILGSMYVGFQQGFVRQGLNLFAIFFSLLVAATYQPRVARFYEGMVGPTGDFVRNTLLFILLVIIVWALVNAAIYFAFRQTRVRTGRTFDQLLGLFLGLINGIISAAVMVMVVSFMTRVEWPDYDEFRRLFAGGLQASILRPWLLSVLPPLVDTLERLVPSGNLPPIFSQFLTR